MASNEAAEDPADMAETPDETPLQHRAEAIRFELALRRQQVTLEEWQGRTRAAEAETERQRQVFSRLEAEFTARSAVLEGAAVERDTALVALQATTDEKIAFERRAGDLAREFGHATALADVRRQLAETLEEDLARARRELGDAQRDLAAARQELHDTHSFLTETRLERERLQQELTRLQDDHRCSQEALVESQRRVEELRGSRWRQIGVGLGLARRASFEK